MRVKDGFMLREIVDSWVVVPIGERVAEFNGVMTLSESGALLWKALENETDANHLVTTILEEYDIDETTARNDVQEFIEEIQERGLCVL